jgi:hypothetical protein
MTEPDQNQGGVVLRSYGKENPPHSWLAYFQCDWCWKDILERTDRWHCADCLDFDLCPGCYARWQKEKTKKEEQKQKKHKKNDKNEKVIEDKRNVRKRSDFFYRWSEVDLDETQLGKSLRNHTEKCQMFMEREHPNDTRRRIVGKTIGESLTLFFEAWKQRPCLGTRLGADGFTIFENYQWFTFAEVWKRVNVSTSSSSHSSLFPLSSLPSPPSSPTSFSFSLASTSHLEMKDCLFLLPFSFSSFGSFPS